MEIKDDNELVKERMDKQDMMLQLILSRLPLPPPQNPYPFLFYCFCLYLFYLLALSMNFFCVSHYFLYYFIYVFLIDDKGGETYLRGRCLIIFNVPKSLTKNPNIV